MTKWMGIILIALNGMLIGVSAEESPPLVRVGQLSQPPTLDGRISEGEWAEATVFTGIVGDPLANAYLLPQSQQVVWYLGFHEDTLYLGMHSPHPKGTFPIGRVKEDDDIDVMWGDHIEVQILTGARSDAGTPGKGFYKMMVNALGAMHDAHMYNGTPGTEDLWSTGGDVKCSVTDDYWELEMSIKAANLQLAGFDGQKAVVQLVRADGPGGMYFAGWVAGTWMAWEKFGDMIWDATAPALQLRQLGKVMEGTLDAAFTLVGTGELPQDVSVEVLVEDAAGKSLFQQVQSTSVLQGQRHDLLFREEGLPISEVELLGGRNHLQITAIWHDGDEDKLLYSQRMPFMKLTPDWRAKYLDPWLAGRSQAGDWEATFAYLPYANKALVKVDTDFFGVAEAVQQADRFAVDVWPKGKPDQSLVHAVVTLTNGYGETLIDLPKLADGQYEASFRLSADGSDTLVAEKIVEFVRKYFPFEHNTLGISDEVIPPYEPLTVSPRTIVGPRGNLAVPRRIADVESIGMWGRVYQLGSLGLFDQIWAAPPTGTAGGLEALLAAPMRLEIFSETKPLDLTDVHGGITHAAPDRVAVEGAALAGNMGIGLKAFAEYDGWYEIALSLTPIDRTVVDSLDLVMDLRDTVGDRAASTFPCDTLYVQRLGGGLDNSYYGGIPRETGVHYRSTSLGNMTQRTGPADIPKDWKSFAPASYVGNGDRGVWLFAWSDDGWKLADDDPMLRVERLSDGTVRVRVRFLSGPEVLEGPRTLRFALQAAPIKPNDPYYRTDIDRIAHDTSGYRYYGDSVDSFVLNSEEEYEALRQFLLYGVSHQAGPNPTYAHWRGRISKLLREGKATRLMLYGSQWMTGLGAEEFDTFGGEWLGSSNWKPSPETKFAGRWNYGRTTQWESPRQLTAARVNWPQSMLDFFIWYHDKLISLSGINGTWWDNCYGGTVTEYNPELGRLDAVWNLYPRRQLCKRLNVIGWKHQQPPCWSLNDEVEMAWCQVLWMVEGFWGPSAKDISTLDRFGSIDFFRAAARPKSSVLICNTSYMGNYHGSTPELERRMNRSADGILLAHDIPPRFDRDLLRKLNYTVDYANTADCLFLGYWATPAFIQSAAQEVTASVYQNASRQSAVILFFNTGKQTRDLVSTGFQLAGVIPPSTAGTADIEGDMSLIRVSDLESGHSLETEFRDGQLFIREPLLIDGHDFRLVAIERP